MSLSCRDLQAAEPENPPLFSEKFDLSFLGCRSNYLEPTASPERTTFSLPARGRLEPSVSTASVHTRWLSNYCCMLLANGKSLKQFNC